MKKLPSGYGDESGYGNGDNNYPYNLILEIYINTQQNKNI
jgi:hypothetical protein